jgi:hypothetical protein
MDEYTLLNRFTERYRTGRGASEGEIEGGVNFGG